MIGTRGSLLALTQCQQVKKQLEDKTGLNFRLEIIKTQGDLDTSKPLWQMEGKDFFTRELDQALLSKQVDLVVHSYKDLGSERPDGIHLAAITERHFANDILLIKNEFLEKIMNNEFNGDFIVGTSSPRRCTNLTDHLNKILPSSKDLNIETRNLRGNVNTRIRKLHQGDYHAIVLAMAGLERLARDQKATDELRPLLKGLNFTILPQRLFTSAASQGALAIECRTSDEGLKEKLALLNHATTIDEVIREREAFQHYGGGCHLAVGIHVRKHQEYFIHYQRGKADNQEVNSLKTEGIDHHLERALEFYKNFKPKNKKTYFFLGMPLNQEKKSSLDRDHSYLGESILYDEIIDKIPLYGDHELINSSRKIFVATAYAQGRLPSQSKEALTLSLWAAGIRTWEKLAKEGFWFHGSSEGVGHQEIHRLSSQSELIKLILKENFNVKKDNYTVLTHKEGDSRLGPVVFSYGREIRTPSSDYVEKLKACPFFYWTSRRQAKTFIEHFPFIRERLHFCGLGKTLKGLLEFDLSPIPVASPKEFKLFIEKL